MPWKGLDITSDEVSLSPNRSMMSIALEQYQKQACRADAIVIGHATSSAYHLSAFQTSIYGDHIFVIDSVLKDNRSAWIRSRPDIVVTRPGGSLLLADGPVNFDNPAFPGFQSGVSYLQFLRYIPESSAYQAIDELSTLVADGHNWAIARKAFSGFVVPEFKRGVLEITIGKWLKSCVQ